MNMPYDKTSPHQLDRKPPGYEDYHARDAYTKNGGKTGRLDTTETPEKAPGTTSAKEPRKTRHNVMFDWGLGKSQHGMNVGFPTPFPDPHERKSQYKEPQTQSHQPLDSRPYSPPTNPIRRVHVRDRLPYHPQRAVGFENDHNYPCQVKSDWHSEYGDSLTDAINVTVKPEACQDITRHLELDVTDDPEPALEEFSKLRRLGHFNEALKLFKDRLDHLLDNAYVRVQYGHCLLDMMDIHGLSKLAGKYPTRISWDSERPGLEEEWFFILKRASYLNDSPLPSLLEKSHWHITFCQHTWKILRKCWPKLDSTEFSIFYHLLLLQGLGTGRFFYITSREIHEIYLHLKTENRIWDFKDLCHGVLSKEIELCHWQDPSPINFQFPAYIFGSFDTNNTDDVIHAIQRDWNVVGEPISSLVLLDIFTICSMTALQHSEYSLSYSVESLRLATRYFAAAKSVAVEVYNQSPSSLVSRPYLEWVIAKVRLQDSYGTPVGERALLKHLFKCEGTVVVPLGIGSYRSSRGLISYNPAGNESPDWQPKRLPSNGPNKTIETVRRLATDLGDMQIQAYCLQYLIYETPTPGGLLKELEELWISTGNRNGQLQTILYRYIPKRSEDDSRRLFEDLLVSRESCLCKSTLSTQLRILRALAPRPHEKHQYTWRLSLLDKMSLEDDKVQLERASAFHFGDQTKTMVSELWDMNGDSTAKISESLIQPPPLQPAPLQPPPPLSRQFPSSPPRQPQPLHPPPLQLTPPPKSPARESHVSSESYSDDERSSDSFMSTEMWKASPRRPDNEVGLWQKRRTTREWLDDLSVAGNKSSSDINDADNKDTQVSSLGPSLSLRPGEHGDAVSPTGKTVKTGYGQVDTHRTTIADPQQSTIRDMADNTAESSASLTQPENQIQKMKPVQSVPYVEDDDEQETDGRRGGTQVQKPVDG